MQYILLAIFLTLNALAAGLQPGLIRSEFIFESAPFPECHASTIEETKDGFVAAWFGGTEERHPDVGIWTSRLIGGKWSTPVEVANGVQDAKTRYPCWNPVLFQPSSGPLLLYYKVGPSPEQWWGMFMTSDDGGKTWSAPKRLPDGIIGPVKNKPIQLPNGDILSGSSTEHHRFRIHFEKSPDLGKSWRVIGPIHDGKKISAIQPTFLVHPGGRIQSIGRTSQNYLFTTESTDGGETWSKISLMDLPNPDAGADAVTLKDGRHLLVYNHSKGRKSQWDYGRQVLNVAVSKDGKNWEAALALESHADGEYSYPSVIQAKDGLVHVTYTSLRKKIRHAVIDPEKLELRPILKGRWPR